MERPLLEDEHRCPIVDCGSPLIQTAWCFSQKREAILALPDDIAEKDILHPSLLLHQTGSLAIYYAPFDWVNVDARVTLVGITPGRHQMWLACRAARDAARRGLSDGATLREAKATAS